MATHGVPRIGSPALREELMSPMPGPEVLGVVKDSLTNLTPQGSGAAWEGPSGTMDILEPPPPWELEDAKYSASDAHRYVDCPANWTLRWINPKLLESNGWDYWKPVLVSADGVKLKVDSMLSPDGTIRRGGATGDILAYMLTSWVVARRELHLKKTRELTASATNRFEHLKDQFRQGAFGPNVTLEESRHPTHTQADGRSLRLDP